MNDKFKKLSLLEQALIEKKKRDMQRNKTSFSRVHSYAVQLLQLLPMILWKEKQRAFINAKQFIKWYLGGYKSGKTFTGVSYLIWLAFVNRPYPGILVHPTFDGHDLTIIPLIDEICKLNNIEYEVKKLSSKYKVYLKFGLDKKDWGCIILASGDKPRSLKGAKLAFGMIDEPFIMKYEIVEVVMSRISDQRAKLCQLIFSGTPEPEHMSWGFDIVDKKYEDTKERFITTVSTREVKEYLRAGYVEDFEANNTAEMVSVFIDGEYRSLSQGKVYYAFKKERNEYDPVNKIPKIHIPERAAIEYAIGYDFNVNQMSATLWKLAGIYRIQEQEFRIQSTSDTKELTELAINRMIEMGYLKKINDKYFTKEGRSLIVTGDAAGRAKSSKSSKSDYDIIMRTFQEWDVKINIYVPDSNPAVRDRINLINIGFEKGTILVSKDCPLSIRDRQLTVWKMGATGFFIDQSKKELTHLAASGDYVIWNTQVLTTGGEGGNNVKMHSRESRR